MNVWLRPTVMVDCNGWLRPRSHPTWQLWRGSAIYVGGRGTYVTCLSHLWVPFLYFFISFFCAQAAFLDRSGRSIRQNACFRPRMGLLGYRQYLTTLSGSTPQKTSPKWARIGISQPNGRSSRTDIGHRWRHSDQISQTDWYRGHSRKKQN